MYGLQRTAEKETSTAQNETIYSTYTNWTPPTNSTERNIRANTKQHSYALINIEQALNAQQSHQKSGDTQDLKIIIKYMLEEIPSHNRAHKI
jgi:hypothetical protein